MSLKVLVPKTLQPKHPLENKDYKFDFGDDSDAHLESGETIVVDATTEVLVDDGITLGTVTITDSSTSITAWISGGTNGRRYKITCKVLTSLGRTLVAVFKLPVSNKPNEYGIA